MTSQSPLTQRAALNSTITSTDGTTIACTTWGDGDPIVIIDGATAYRATTPENAQAAELLADDFLVVSYDRRGRGESSNTLPYAVEREFEDLAAVIDQVAGGRPATVFGWSSGAVLALNAVQAGVQLARLVAWEPPVVVGDAREPLPADYVEQLDAAVAEGRPGDAVALFLTATAGLPEEMVSELRKETEMWAGLEAIAPTIAYDGRQVGDIMSGRPLPTTLWDRVRIPVRVLHGKDTWPHLAAGAVAVADHLPTATLKVVPGEDHSTTPDVLAHALREFIKEA